jgi:N-succinyldiaminopimelate aminotransferase
MAERVAGFGTTIFTEINNLAAEHSAINLGQGAPDFPAPPHVIDITRKVVETARYQYSPGWGYPELHVAVAEHAARFYEQDVDPTREVLITNGATEGIFASMMGLINPGDEVILFEPFYDSYLPSLKWAGGIPRYIPLHAPDWHFDRDELARLFSDKTRAIFVNTPHNPTGKVYTEDELSFIAELCQKYDVIAVTDEVYEHILFDNSRHIRMATLPGMENRTVTLSSLGKSFTVTGWKIGWAIGDATLMTGMFRARQFISFAVASLLQWAAVEILRSPDQYFADLRTMYQAKRDFLFDALAETPLKPLASQGTYFIMTDNSALGLPDDRAFAEYLVKEIGVACIPPGAFYSDANRHLAKNLARFSICKTDETLKAAADRLRKISI